MITWVVGVLVWFVCGWVGGILLRKDWETEGSEWNVDQEVVTRVFLLAGPFLLFAGFGIWFIRHIIQALSVKRKRSWFGRRV